jgi:prolyl-tRNA synthetase
MLSVYRTFAEETMAIPVLVGKKTESEKFAGALHTYCIEAMMQDRKALQAGTSHNLGQNFAKAFDITFLSKDQKREHAWTTSWGVSTRLIGGVVMAHSDDDGLVLPPRVAPVHVVVIPIYRSDDERSSVLAYLSPLVEKLRATTYAGRPVRVEVDDRDTLRPGAKHFEWEKKGVPLRLECGPRDVSQGNVVVGTRFAKSKEPASRDAFAGSIAERLSAIQKGMLEKARAFRDEHTKTIDARDDFVSFFTPGNALKPEIHGGFARAHGCCDAACERDVKERLSVTVRCLELDAPPAKGPCIACGRPSEKRVVWAKSY